MLTPMQRAHNIAHRLGSLHPNHRLEAASELRNFVLSRGVDLGEWLAAAFAALPPASLNRLGAYETQPNNTTLSDADRATYRQAQRTTAPNTVCAASDPFSDDPPPVPDHPQQRHPTAAQILATVPFEAPRIFSQDTRHRLVREIARELIADFGPHLNADSLDMCRNLAEWTSTISRKQDSWLAKSETAVCRMRRA